MSTTAQPVTARAERAERAERDGDGNAEQAGKADRFRGVMDIMRDLLMRALIKTRM